MYDIVTSLVVPSSVNCVDVNPFIISSVISTSVFPDNLLTFNLAPFKSNSSPNLYDVFGVPIILTLSNLSFTSTSNVSVNPAYFTVIVCVPN